MSTTVYTVSLYHDEPGEAAANVRGDAARYPTERAARKGAKAALTDYWNSASVGSATLVPGVYGEFPPYLRDFEPLRHIGPDWDEPA